MTVVAAKTLAAKLAEVLEAVGYIPKNGTNTAQGYKFVTDADVLDTVRTALAARKVATAVSVTRLEHVPYTTAKGSPQFLATVEGTLTFLDGESDSRIDIPFVGAGADSGDKGAYKAITGGVKYALLKSFLIPTGDDPENDEKPATRDTVSVAPVQRAPTASQKPAAAPAATEGTTDAPKGLTVAQHGMYRAKLRERGITSADQSRLFAYQSVGKYSTKDFTAKDFDEVLKILDDPEGYGQVFLEFVKGAAPGAIESVAA